MDTEPTLSSAMTDTAAAPAMVIGAGSTTLQVPIPVSPTSSQGSWVVNPEDGGWDGLGQSPPLSPSRQQSQFQQRRSTPSTSPRGSWAGLHSSPVAVEYPASPPGSPASVRSEGLAGLAREEVHVATDGLAAALDNAIDGAEGGKRKSEGGTLIEEHKRQEGECKADFGVGVAADAMGASLSHSAVDDVAQAAAVAERVVVADDGIREKLASEVDDTGGPDATSKTSAPEGEGVATPSVSRGSSATLGAINAPLPRPATPPNIRRSGGTVPVERSPLLSCPRAATPPITASPRRGITTMGSSTTKASQVVDPIESARASSTRLPGGNPLDVETEYEGKNVERLFKWTGLITAAKMGVIPIVVCAALAAISNQGGGGDDRGSRGGGGGGGSRGGGGPTRCSSRRRPRGGGGGNGCFPSMRADRYGCMPMPYAGAPAIFVIA